MRGKWPIKTGDGTITPAFTRSEIREGLIAGTLVLEDRRLHPSGEEEELLGCDDLFLPEPAANAPPAPGTWTSVGATATHRVPAARHGSAAPFPGSAEARAVNSRLWGLGLMALLGGGGLGGFLLYIQWQGSERRSRPVEFQLSQDEQNQDLDVRQRLAQSKLAPGKRRPSKKEAPTRKRRAKSAGGVAMKGVLPSLKGIGKYNGRLVRVGPLAFFPKALDSCEVKCSLPFYDRKGREITVAFFKAVFAPRLARKHDGLILEGTVRSRGRKLLLKELVGFPD